jgi:hypothetical protein
MSGRARSHRRARAELNYLHRLSHCHGHPKAGVYLDWTTITGRRGSVTSSQTQTGHRRPPLPTLNLGPHRTMISIARFTRPAPCSDPSLSPSRLPVVYISCGAHVRYFRFDRNLLSLLGQCFEQDTRVIPSSYCRSAYEIVLAIIAILVTARGSRLLGSSSPDVWHISGSELVI